MADRIHIRPVGDVKIRFPNGRVLPPEGAMVKPSLFVQRRIDKKEVEVVETPASSPVLQAQTTLVTTIDDAAVETTSEEHSA
jgi:hypothetical protein